MIVLKTELLLDLVIYFKKGCEKNLDFITENWIQILVSLGLAALFFVPVNNVINYFMYEEQPLEIVFEIDQQVQKGNMVVLIENQNQNDIEVFFNSDILDYENTENGVIIIFKDSKTQFLFKDFTFEQLLPILNMEILDIYYNQTTNTTFVYLEGVE